MNILFDLGHPAHFHLFKNFINYLKDSSINVFITTRDKDIVNTLLEKSNLNYIQLSKPRKSIFGMFWELIYRDIKLILLFQKYKFTYMFGSSINITHLSALTKAKSFFFAEDDDDIVPLSRRAMSSAVTKIINPSCIRTKKWKEKRVFHNSLHELAYLHPNNFSPDEDILKKYNLVKKRYVVLRIVAMKAHHDVGVKGISNELYFKIKELLQDYTIIESRENSIIHQIDPFDMHHILAFSKMIICDSQTMTVEAAVLGIPSVRINNAIHWSSIIGEIEKKYNLSYGFYPNDETEALNTIKYLASDKDVDSIWKEKRKIFLADKCDFNNWMIEYFEKEIKNIKI